MEHERKGWFAAAAETSEQQEVVGTVTKGSFVEGPMD